MPDGESGIFCKGGWTGKSLICPSGKIKQPVRQQIDGLSTSRNLSRFLMGTERAFRYVALLALHRALGFDGPTTDDSESDFDMPHPVDDDPVMASAIGRCSNQWTHAETRLAWIFSHLTKTDIAIAVTVFSFFKSTRTQRDVLKKLAKISPFMTNELRDRLTQALRTYCALAEGRNQLLHNPIGRSVENQVYIMLRSQTPVHGELPYQSKPISPSEIDELSTNIKNFVLDLRDLEDSIGKARFALPSS